jgi:hypothetical protein
MVRFVALSALLSFTTFGHATQTKPKPGAKPPVKPAAKPSAPPVRPVQGTAQLPGDNGKLGTTYTLGRLGADAVNFTLNSAEFVLGPVTIGGNVFAAAADQKLLVLKYTLHNPSQIPMTAGWDTVSMTAVDSVDTNHSWAQVASRTGTTDRLDFELKPAQKVEATTVIVVPAKGVIPKLICQRLDATPVLRFDLRNAVKPLPDPWRDPADSSGATVLKSIDGKVGTAVTTGKWTVTVDKFERNQKPPEGVELEEGSSIQWVHATLTNATTEEQTLNWAALYANWEDNEAVGVEYNQTMLRATRDGSVDVALPPGKSLSVRYFVVVPKGSTMKTLILSEPDAQRKVNVEIPA